MKKSTRVEALPPASQADKSLSKKKKSGKPHMKKKAQKLGASEVSGDLVSQEPLSKGEAVDSRLSANGVSVGHVPEPVGMQIYWNLSSVDPIVREAASVALVGELVGAQKDYEEKGLGQEEKAAEAVFLGAAKTEEQGLEKCAPAVQYALRRLVRGVASSRESARQGFALALAAVLGALPCVSGATLIKMINKHLEVASSMKGQEARDALLGQLFAFAGLIRSSRAVGEGSSSEQQELAKEITQQLLSLAKKKIFLREPAVYVLVEFGEKLQTSVIEKGVCEAPLFLESLKEESDTFSPDILFLALKLHQNIPKPILQSCPLMPESGNLVDIFEKEQLLRLVPCLKESSNSHPRLHSVWGPLLEILFPKSLPQSLSKKNKRRRSSGKENLETRLSTFWNIVVDGSLLTSSHERKHLAMQLLLLFLPKLPSYLYVKHVLSSNFVQCLLGAITSKENLLYKSAHNCIAEICKWAEGDDERRVSVVISLQQGSYGRFDHLSKTKSVKGLLSGLTTIAGYQSTFAALSSLYVSGESSGDVLGNSSMINKKQKSRAEDTEGDGVKDASTDHETRQNSWAVDQLRALCQQALVELPVNVAVEELIAKFVPSFPPVRPFTVDEVESVATLQSTMLQISSALSLVEAGEQKDRLQAMLSLLVQLLFESRLVPSVAVETAAEISICCKKAFGNLVELEVESDAEDGEQPAFMDVLIDVLLSLLAQPSAPIRAAADQVFKSFCGDLTSSGLTDLLRIVKKNTQRSRHKPLVEVDSQNDNDDEDILDVEESDGDSGGEDEESAEEDKEKSDHDEADSESDEDLTIPGLKQKVEVPAKGKEDDFGALKDKDEDDEAEPSDLDDEAMFRMDRLLANALKQRKQGPGNGTEDSKDAQTQLMHFKFRVLALLDFFLQKHSDSMLVLMVLPALLHVFVNSCTTDGNSQIADRVSSILQNKLFKGKQYPKGPEVDQSSLKELLKKALKLASRSTIKRVTMMAQAACYWILKVIHGNLEEEKDKEVEEMFASALQDFFMHKKCRLSSSFFKECFSRNPWLGNCLLGAVLEKCVTARTEYLQFESLQLAVTILGCKTGKSAKKSKQCTSDVSLQLRAAALKPHLLVLKKTILHLLKNASSVKAGHRIEALQFCVSSMELYKTLYPGKSLMYVMEPNDLMNAFKEISAPPKSKLSNLLVKLQQLEEISRKK